MNDDMITLLERCQLALFAVINCVDAEMPIDNNNAIMEPIRDLEDELCVLLVLEEQRRN